MCTGGGIICGCLDIMIEKSILRIEYGVEANRKRRIIPVKVNPPQVLAEVVYMLRSLSSHVVNVESHC